VKQLNVVLPLSNAEMKPANEKVSEIMNFSCIYTDHYRFGYYNFSSCAARATTASGAAKRSASEMKLKKRASCPISFAESESDCEEKDPTYVPPRAKNRKIAE